MGCGKNGSFDKSPDWLQWAMLTVHPTLQPEAVNDTTPTTKEIYGNFIGKWLRFFNCETWSIYLSPTGGHGTWNGKKPFEPFTASGQPDTIIAVLTRATIRFSGLKAFWSNVDAVAAEMAKADGFITSIGIGEIPFIKQATFSLWQSAGHMKAFAYQSGKHRNVIQKTRSENWYSEEMFVRFRPIKATGTLNGKNPLEGKP